MIYKKASLIKRLEKLKEYRQDLKGLEAPELTQTAPLSFSKTLRGAQA
jgi:hypothetical protein